MNNYILTKDDFISEDNDSASNELSIFPESSEDETEIHHDMLVKLKNRLSSSNKWLDNISNNLLRAVCGVNKVWPRLLITRCLQTELERAGWRKETAACPQ